MGWIRGVFRWTVVLLAFALGLVAMHRLEAPRRPRLPDPASVVFQMREVARLQTLDLTLYKKVSFEPDPEPAASVWGDVFNWAKYNLHPSRGKAIVFGKVHVGLSLKLLDEQHLRISGSKVQIVLPPLQTQVELMPGETEVIRSNLDSQETAQLMELAKVAFEREVEADPELRQKATDSAQRALQGLLFSLGFQTVEFVPSLPAVAGTN